jgi:hypothetical protein
LRFTYTESDLKGFQNEKVVIVHDVDGNGEIQNDEILHPEIEKIGSDIFVATIEIPSLSKVALGLFSSSGSGGDSSPPDIEGFTYSSGSGGYSSDGIGFNNELEPINVKTGEPFTITLTVQENSGVQALQHISLYMNLRGLDDQVHESDTYIRWDKGFPVSVKDPHGYFANADIEVFEVGSKIQIIFKFKFALAMETSDVIIRTWDVNRNSMDSHFLDLITVTGSPYYGEPLGTIDLGDFLGKEATSSLGGGNGTLIFPSGFLDRWSDFSSGTVSDAELLELLGLGGDDIPEWFKNTTAKWFMEDKISLQEFIDALTYMANENLLFVI